MHVSARSGWEALFAVLRFRLAEELVRRVRMGWQRFARKVRREHRFTTRVLAHSSHPATGR